MLNNEKMAEEMDMENIDMKKELTDVYQALVRTAFEDNFIFEFSNDSIGITLEYVLNTIVDDIHDLLGFYPNEELVKRALLELMKTSPYGDVFYMYSENIWDGMVFGVYHP